MIIKSKKVVALLCAAAIATSAQSMIFAEYDPNRPIDPSSSITATKSVPAPIFVNNQKISGTYFTDGENIMLPIRAVAESLGITVTWNDEAKRVELTQDDTPLYVTFRIGTDGYTFAKTAPLQLGNAPVIVNERTFVPLALITDIMGGNASFEGDALYVAYGDTSAQESLFGNATIISINEDEILVNDDERGEVRLGLHDDLIINDENGDEITASDLLEGMNVTVEYSEQMGKSLPPFNAPVSITVNAQNAYATVTVKETGEDFILVNDANLGDVILFVGDETSLSDEAGEKLSVADIKEGAALLVKYSPAMTASLPPQNAAEEIIVVSTVEISGTVIEADENGILVEWTDGTYRELYLNVSDNTVLANTDGSEVTLSDFTKDSEIVANASTMMTRSLPPQCAAYTVTITK